MIFMLQLLQSNQNNTTFPWETIVAIIGALAWFAPWVYDVLQKPDLKGKLISFNSNKGTYENGGKVQEGLLYFLSVSLISLHKQFNIKEIKIFIKYPNDDKEHNVKVIWARKSNWVDSVGKKYELVMPNNEFLSFISTLPKDESRKSYITFFVDKGTIEDFDYIKLELTPYRGNTKTINFNMKDIDPNLMLWDENVWKEVMPQ